MHTHKLSQQTSNSTGTNGKKNPNKTTNNKKTPKHTTQRAVDYKHLKTIKGKGTSKVVNFFFNVIKKKNGIDK